MSANQHIPEEAIGQVIRILSDTSLIINAGKNLGLSEGKEVEVFSIVDDVNDIDGTYLGKLIYRKAKLKITQCEEMYSICSTTTYVSNGITQLVTSPLLLNSVKHKKIDVDPDEINPMPDTDKSIKIGDFVKIN